MAARTVDAVARPGAARWVPEELSPDSLRAAVQECRGCELYADATWTTNVVKHFRFAGCSSPGPTTCPARAPRRTRRSGW